MGIFTMQFETKIKIISISIIHEEVRIEVTKTLFDGPIAESPPMKKEVTLRADEEIVL